MAYIVNRTQADGSVTYQVKWREGGARGGAGQSEKFGDANSAETFKKLVDAHGQHWPPGWVKGEGFVEVPQTPGDMPLIDWANQYVDRLTGIEPRTRSDYRREIRLHISLIRHTRADGRVEPATVCTVTQDDITDWVRLEEEGEQAPDGTWLRRRADPKSIANRHGLLFCIFAAAIDRNLRTTNPCAKTRLPRVDTELVDDMVYLERDEYQRIAAEITDPTARDIADILVGTGMRWGEVTALQVRDVTLTGPTPVIRVQRAWRRQDDNKFALGPPKTKRSRRTLGLAPAQIEIIRRHITGQRGEEYIFRTVRGNPWRHSNYYNRKWVPAVRAAEAKGLTKRPRIHDLRHTHVSWLIAANIPLPAIQARLGHESITTTVDRYGHLVRSLDSEISAAVEAAMASVTGNSGGLRVVS